ncbi:MAG: hypothetical protein U5K79_24980 [Cyclobacteriaceae bacterium]|nr:hypothetical protein [Cyclobacteriaceae bacterium]
MIKFLKQFLFPGKPLAIKIWLWSAMACVAFLLVKSFFAPASASNVSDLILMAYGAGSLGFYLLVFGFDWSR